MEETGGLLTAEPPIQFFATLFGEAAQRRRVRFSPAAEMYVVSVLARLALHGQEAEEDIAAPLTPRYLEACTRGMDKMRREQLLQSIGDDTLMLCGFFWRRMCRLDRRPLNPEFHIDRGRAAYRYLGKTPFTDVAAHFLGVLEVLMQMGDAFLPQCNDDLLRLLAVWEESRNRYAARLLRTHGIDPGQIHSTAPS